MAMIPMKTLRPYCGSYDHFADVLYLSEGRPVASHTEEDDFGLIWRLSIDNKRVVGVTVIDFHSIWLSKLEILSNLLKN